MQHLRKEILYFMLSYSFIELYLFESVDKDILSNIVTKKHHLVIGYHHIPPTLKIKPCFGVLLLVNIFRCAMSLPSGHLIVHNNQNHQYSVAVLFVNFLPSIFHISFASVIICDVPSSLQAIGGKHPTFFL